MGWGTKARRGRPCRRTSPGGRCCAGYLRWESFGERSPKGASELARASGALPSLATLLVLGAEDFHVESRETLHYEVSALWIEYLLDDPGLADGFRAFLAYLAAGGPWGLDPALESLGPARESTPLGDDLLHFLGRRYEPLDAGFRAWLWSRTEPGADVTGGESPSSL